jgi:hypothetical protein
MIGGIALSHRTPYPWFIMHAVRLGTAVDVRETEGPPRRLTRRERLIWFVLPGILMVAAGVLLVRLVETHKSKGFFPGNFEPQPLPSGAYHLDLGIGWGLVGIGALMMLTGAVWHALSAKNRAGSR